MRRLIPNILPWLGRNYGNLTFHLTQAFSGHECFAGYLHRFSLLNTAECWICGNNTDDVLHTLFKCDAWEDRRVALSKEIGEFTPENLVPKMIASKHVWYAAAVKLAYLNLKKNFQRGREA